MSVHAFMLTKTNTNNDVCKCAREDQYVAWNSIGDQPAAALRHSKSRQHTLHLPTSCISKQQHAAPLLCMPLQSKSLHWPATADLFGSVVGKLCWRVEPSTGRPVSRRTMDAPLMRTPQQRRRGGSGRKTPFEGDKKEGKARETLATSASCQLARREIALNHVTHWHEIAHYDSYFHIFIRSSATG